MRELVREKFPALAFALALQLVAAIFFVRSLIVPLPPQTPSRQQTQIIFLPTLPPAVVPPKKRERQRQGGSNAVTPYFNPYTFDPHALSGHGPEQLATALSACDPDKYTMASDEVRAVCDRIGAMIRYDSGRFGFTSHVNDPLYWRRELARREAPYLAPCMSPNGVDVLYTLTCIYEEIFTGHREDKRRRYSE